MSVLSLVCPFDQKLFARLPKRPLVVIINEITVLPEIEPEVNRYGHQLNAIIYESGEPLSAVLPLPSWGGALLSLHVSELGLVRDIVPYLDELRSNNLKIFMPASEPKNLTGVRILSSLGVLSGLTFEEDGDSPDWEQVSDLMHYYAYGRVWHAPIEPFHYIATNYHPNSQLEFGGVYFDDPAQYLHLDSTGRIASNRRNLLNHRFICDDLEDLENIAENKAYQDAINEWRDFFLQREGCAYCQGWRVCMGRFSSQAKDGGCERFFAELMEAVDLIQKNKGEANQCRR